FGFSLGPIVLNKPVLLWINDGLMAVFFLLVGLEIKREVVEGALSQPSQIALPVVAAAGGMAVPAVAWVPLERLVYAVSRGAYSTARGGGAPPAATDIAFSLGVLAALGSRVPL